MMCNREGVPIEPMAGHVRTRHKVRGDISKEVNSFHNYGILKCPKIMKFSPLVMIME